MPIAFDIDTLPPSADRAPATVRLEACDQSLQLSHKEDVYGVSRLWKMTNKASCGKPLYNNTSNSDENDGILTVRNVVDDIAGSGDHIDDVCLFQSLCIRSSSAKG